MSKGPLKKTAEINDISSVDEIVDCSSFCKLGPKGSVKSVVHAEVCLIGEGEGRSEPNKVYLCSIGNYDCSLLRFVEENIADEVSGFRAYCPSGWGFGIDGPERMY